MKQTGKINTGCCSIDSFKRVMTKTEKEVNGMASSFHAQNKLNIAKMSIIHNVIIEPPELWQNLSLYK